MKVDACHLKHELAANSPLRLTGGALKLLYLFTGPVPNRVRCCPGDDARARASG